MKNNNNLITINMIFFYDKICVYYLKQLTIVPEVDYTKIKSLVISCTLEATDYLSKLKLNIIIVHTNLISIFYRKYANAVSEV